MRRERFIYRNCIQCGAQFRLTPADLEETGMDHRFCTDDCERISKELDAAEIRREERAE